MSTGKRLAKRSILGTKVMVPGQDGKFYPGHIQAVKSSFDETTSCRYSVRFEENRRVFEFTEKDIIGPGFSGVGSVQLLQGQVVYVTHNQREMSGKVVRHDFFAQDVLITVSTGNEEETILGKVDDVRLLESRKSARLVNSDTDFSKLADINISMADKKKAAAAAAAGLPAPSSSWGKSVAIEVPRSDYVQIAGSRKRRTSENVADEEEVLSECSAAMLLMKLSCSPHSPFSPQMAKIADLPSPLGSSSGASSFRSLTPSPPLSSSNTDEGIVKDIKKQIIYQCTYPGCHEQRSNVDSMESHVRVEHLNRPEELDLSIDEADRDHEEEFYYSETEVDIDHFKLQHSQQQMQHPPSRRMASLSLADHLDMARPAHEDPGGPRHQQPPIVLMASSAAAKRRVHHSAIGASGQQQQQSLLSRSLPNQSSMPISIAPSTAVASGNKFILISPPARSLGAAASAACSVATSLSSSTAMTSEGKSPSKRLRDGKKCRKVFGLEQRDLWCTQCKWKKACARFGAHATEPFPSSASSTASSSSSSILQVSTASVVTVATLPSASATTVLTGVKAIKF